MSLKKIPHPNFHTLCIGYVVKHIWKSHRPVCSGSGEITLGPKNRSYAAKLISSQVSLFLTVLLPIHTVFCAELLDLQLWRALMDTGTLWKKGTKNVSFVLWADFGIQKHSEVALTLLAAPRKTWNGREEVGPPAQECTPHGPGPGAPLDQKQHVSWQSFRQQAVIFLSIISIAVYHHNLESQMLNLNSAKLLHSRRAGLSSTMLNKTSQVVVFLGVFGFPLIVESQFDSFCAVTSLLLSSNLDGPEEMSKFSAPGWSDKTSRETEVANCTFKCIHT